MQPNDNNVSRRNVLKATGGAAAALGVTGLASAKPSETVEVNVGYGAESGLHAARAAADTVVREFNFDALTVQLPKAAADQLSARGDIRYVELNGEMHALAQTLPWGVDRVDAEVAHSNGYTGSGVDLAIVDTGIDSDHPDLQANLGSGHAVVSCATKRKGGCRYGLSPSDNPCHTAWDDDNEHGTHCAGIADAVNNSQGVVGVSTQATLHAVKVLDECGSGSFSDVAAGIQYVADQGWDVASLSLGGGASSTVKDAGTYADNKGVLLVAAAGNSGPCTHCVGYPAAYSEFIAVSATTSSDGLASFSSTGPEVELAAPGKDIYSTVPGGYATLSGTSMACPHVSGAGAQLMAQGYTNTEARNQLTSTAEDIGLSSNEQGSGLLDVAASLGLNSSNN